MWTSLDMNPAAIVPGTGMFSTKGDDGKPQPDNFLFRQTGRAEDVEHCVAVFNNRNNDGVKLHDQVGSYIYYRANLISYAREHSQNRLTKTSFIF